jgi:hypothetical protein
MLYLTAVRSATMYGLSMITGRFFLSLVYDCSDQIATVHLDLGDFFDVGEHFFLVSRLYGNHKHIPVSPIHL